DALLRQRQEVQLPRLPRLREHDVRDGLVRHLRRQAEQPAAELDVGHGLDVEYEHVDHDVTGARISTAIATMSPASSLNERYPSPTPSLRHMSWPRSE